MTQENKNKSTNIPSAKSPNLTKDELKSAAGGADCTKGPDGVSFDKVRSKGQATHDIKRPTRP